MDLIKSLAQPEVSYASGSGSQLDPDPNRYQYSRDTHYTALKQSKETKSLLGATTLSLPLFMLAYLLPKSRQC